MDINTKTVFLVLATVVFTSLSLGYSNTDTVKLYRGEKVDLGEYGFEYDTVGVSRFEVTEEREGTRYMLEQIPIEDLYDRKGENLEFPENKLYVVFEGIEWSEKGSYLNLTVSSKKDIFTDAKIEADVPQRVIAARGDKINVPITLKNEGTRNTTYNLSHNASKGLSVTYGYQGFNVSEIEVPAGETFELSATIEVLESANVGSTKVLFGAEASKEITEEVEVEVRGSKKRREVDFQIDENYILTWPGKEATVNAEIRNTGDAPVQNVEFDLKTPDGWEVDERGMERPIDVLEKFDRHSKYYRVKVPSNVESGDYYVTVDPSSENLDIDSKEIRVHVRTKSGLSYVGIALIVISLLGMGLTYRKLGRR